MPRIDIKELTVTYLLKDKSTIKAIDNLSFSFPSNKTSIIMGENGCGKSTLLKAICCFFRFDGHIFIDGVDVESQPIKNFNLAYVDQDFNLYPQFDVFDNIAFPLKKIKLSADEIDKRVNQIAKELEINNCLSRKPKELSIGQQQRVAFARALVRKPNILLLDEVFSNLDEPTHEKTRTYLKEMIKAYNITCLYVTHNVNDALKMGDNIYTMTPSSIRKSK